MSHDIDLVETAAKTDDVIFLNLPGHAQIGEQAQQTADPALHIIMIDVFWADLRGRQFQE
ncbi:MAG: hypothetical protein U0S50_08105 [Sphingopyxis sp.]|uniref:hypothetical protein n=1 Tax=Sphingopyxis sp. TaxID=1908224 RepID=UPI002ABC2911|nr:hypothetical protein [Sphingopyxis sp.]MDZ3831763.1 hypothetical protein [Sphingopyxis sp.]